MILLDTHVLVWVDQGASQLGPRARRVIEAAYAAEELLVATISFWEIGRLAARGRLAFEGELVDWRVSLINSGFKEVAADGVIALSAAGLRDFEGDAADRLIAATSVVSEARLVTADPRFIGFRGIRTINATT